MDILFQTRGIKLINRLFTPNKTVSPAVPFYPQKADPLEKPVGEPFPRVTPEQVGISSETVNKFLCELASDSTLNMHGITMVRDGCVFCDADFGVYRSDICHTTYSMCKTVVAIAIGMLFDEGVLSPDDTLAELLDKGGITKFIKNGITLKELLTMSTGVSFNELGAVTETEWEKAFFESATKFDPGEKFDYNSMNTYMLSCVVKKVSGMGVNEYLEKRLWSPLAINHHPWEISPEGIEKGGWGLYLRREDAAKIGVLLMNGGVWKGKRLLSEKTVNLFTRRHRQTPAEYGGFDYGCQIWVGRNYKGFLLNGMFGQNVLGISENGIVISVNGGNDEVFQQSAFFSLTEKYFGHLSASSPLPENKKAYRALCKTASTLCEEKRVVKQSLFARIKSNRFLQSVSGASYRITSKNAVSAGLLPVVLRAVQNNHSAGIKSVSFQREDDKLYVDFVSSDGLRRVTAGLDRVQYTTLDFGNEKYIVGSTARVGKNEDGIPVITLYLAFCETASDRVIKFYFLPANKMRITFTERPGNVLFERAAEMLSAGGKNKLLANLTGKTDTDYIRYRINSTFNPEYTAEKE